MQSSGADGRRTREKLVAPMSHKETPSELDSNLHVCQLCLCCMYDSSCCCCTTNNGGFTSLRQVAPMVALQTTFAASDRSPPCSGRRYVCGRTLIYGDLLCNIYIVSGRYSRAFVMS